VPSSYILQSIRKYESMVMKSREQIGCARLEGKAPWVTNRTISDLFALSFSTSIMSRRSYLSEGTDFTK
jgi:hypothetical protein